MRAAKSVITKNIKKLQLALEEFRAFEGLNLPVENLHKVDVAVDECIKVVEDSYSRIESFNKILLLKLILVDRVG